MSDDSRLLAVNAALEAWRPCRPAVSTATSCRWRT